MRTAVVVELQKDLMAAGLTVAGAVASFNVVVA